MREILFKAKRKYNGEWVKGAYCPKNSKGDIPCIIVYNDVMAGYWFEVDPETVCQYTGLKDKNGRRIYEGDIVKILDFQSGLVVHEEGCFGVAVMPIIDWNFLASEIKGITGCDNVPSFCENDNFVSLWELMWNYNQEENICYVVEVIGNIFDNPELMESE